MASSRSDGFGKLGALPGDGRLNLSGAKGRFWIMDKEQALEWHSVAKIGDMREDEPKPVRIGDRLIALYHIDGKIYATDDVCSHEFAMLSEGFVEGEEIECPLHQARFHIPTGQVRAGPATEDIATFPVRIEGEDIMIGVPTK